MYFWQFRAAIYFSRVYCANSEICAEKLHVEFLALNVDFDGPSLDFLDSRKSAHAGIKEQYPHKSCYFIVVGSLL